MGCCIRKRGSEGAQAQAGHTASHGQRPACLCSSVICPPAELELQQKGSGVLSAVTDLVVAEILDDLVAELHASSSAGPRMPSTTCRGSQRGPWPEGGSKGRLVLLHFCTALLPDYIVKHPFVRARELVQCIAVVSKP